MALTDSDLIQVKDYIVRLLPEVLEHNSYFGDMVYNIVTTRLSRPDEFARLLEQLDAYNEQYPFDFPKTHALMGQLVQRLDNLQADVTELQSGQEQLRAGQDELRAGQEQLRSDVTGLRAGQEQLRSDVTELRSDVTELRSDVTELRSDVTELRSDVTELRSDVTELRSDVTELRSDVTELRSDVTELRSDVTELRSDVTELRSDVTELRSDVTELRSDVTELRSDVTELRSDVTELRAGQEQLRQLIDDRTEMLRQELNRVVANLGQRWGLMTEDVLRQVVKAIVQETYGGAVREQVIEGEQFDCVVTDGQHILLEITARANSKIIRRMLQKRKLYTQYTGIEPTRVLLATAQIHYTVVRRLQELGIEVIQPEVLTEDTGEEGA
jgi:hypothetical protein